MNLLIPSNGINGKVASGVVWLANKIPGIKNAVSTPEREKVTKRVTHVAVEIFKVVGIVAIGAGFGALVAVGFGGWIPVVIGTVAGGLCAGIAFFATKSVMMAINYFCYPANKKRTIDARSTDDWVCSKNEKAFKDVLKSFEGEGWYDDWLKAKGFTRCNNFMWRRFQRDLSHGESYALLQSVIDGNYNASANDLMGDVPARAVFKQQVQAIILKDLDAILKKNKSDTIKGVDRDLLKAYKKILQKKLRKVPDAKVYKPLHLDKNTIVNSENFADAFAAITARQDRDHFAGVIKIEGKHRTQTLFFQSEEGAFRFYDNYNSRFTGFYEYENEDDFVEGLQRHLQSYAKIPNKWLKTYNKATVQLYGFNEQA